MAASTPATPSRVSTPRSRGTGIGCGAGANALREEIELVRGASHAFDLGWLSGRPPDPGVFRLGADQLRCPGNAGRLRRKCTSAARLRRRHPRTSRTEEDAFTGFVFKIQANMDPQHRDRIAFLRICSGRLSARHESSATFGWVARSRSPTPSPSWPPSASMPMPPIRATSSACTTTAPSASATPSPRARTSLHWRARLCPGTVPARPIARSVEDEGAAKGA
jgi:hypothetical protein